MISIDTYLCNSHGEHFVLVEPGLEYTIGDGTYINGAIELIIDGTAILDHTMWDLIDQLWVYLTSMLERFTADGHATLHFPDQPLTFSVERIRRRGFVRVTSHLPQRRAAVVAEDEFLEVTTTAGVTFFTAMNRLHPREHFDDQIRKLLRNVTR